jgi:hypothetical protein
MKKKQQSFHYQEFKRVNTRAYTHPSNGEWSFFEGFRSHAPFKLYASKGGALFKFYASKNHLPCKYPINGICNNNRPLCVMLASSIRKCHFLKRIEPLNSLDQTDLKNIGTVTHLYSVEITRSRSGTRRGYVKFSDHGWIRYA